MKKLSVIASLLACAISQQAAAKPLFEGEEPMKAVLSAPITQVYKQAKKEVRLYLNGSFAYSNNGGSAKKIPLTIKTRGNFRRKNCRFPPLRLNFKKKQNNENLFRGQNKLKLVGPCKKGKNYQSLLALEYMVYQMFEEVSDYHFKTRLLELSYIDTDDKQKPRTATTFLIEDVSDMAKRSGMKEQKIKTVSRANLDLQHAALVEIFQLMISNYDYSLLQAPGGDDCCHNARLIANKDGSGKVIAVPYDFDVSGFVDAPYATPPANFDVSSVRVRTFTGFCKEDRHFRSAIAKFNQRKGRIYDVVRLSDLVGEKTKKRALGYLDKFYKIVNDESKLQKKIIGRCRGAVIRG